MTHPVAVDDFIKLKIVSDPQVAPDGARIACVVRLTEPDKNRYRSEIWVTPTQGGAPRRYTGEESSCGSPRWSPDGQTLAFVSDRQKPGGRIYLLPVDGGEARALTTLEGEGSVRGLRWSPDGSRIAFLFRSTPEAARKEKVEEREKQGRSFPVRHHTRLFYRLDGAGYFDGEYSQIWVVEVATGACRALTSGPFECGLPVWSPDGQTLAFLSDRRDDGDISPADTALYTVLAEGGELQRLPAPVGSKSGLAWSPDGAHFAYLGNPDPEDSWGTNNTRLMLLPAGGAETAWDLTGAFDISVGYDTLSDSHDAGAGDPIRWSAEGNHLLFPVSIAGDTLLCSLAADGSGEPIYLTPQGHEMGGFSLTPGGRTLAVTLGSSTAPHELYASVPDGEGAWRPLTEFNRPFVESASVVSPEPVAVRHGAGETEVTVHGWLLKPPDFVPGARYPLVLYVHGGPHTQYGNSFFHELQYLASCGYLVLYTNPRGSKGYGEAHTRAILGNWGGPDFEDIQAMADYAAGLDSVDPERMAIMGGSYGGYMTAWAIGHTDRFRCAIADRLVGNLHSMSGTCDFPWKHTTYFKGDAWNDPSDLWRCSPLAYAGNITTPLLIIHSDGDLRCPAGQAEELFTALRLQRKTVEYLRYPAESSHGLSRNGPPDLRLDRLERNRAWLDRWLKA